MPRLQEAIIDMGLLVNLDANGNPTSITTPQGVDTGIMPAKMPTSARPAWSTAYVGRVYFDTTLNKLVIGGASAWEAVTSV